MFISQALVRLFAQTPNLEQHNPETPNVTCTSVRTIVEGLRGGERGEGGRRERGEGKRREMEERERRGKEDREREEGERKGRKCDCYLYRCDQDSCTSDMQSCPERQNAQPSVTWSACSPRGLSI